MQFEITTEQKNIEVVREQEGGGIRSGWLGALKNNGFEEFDNRFSFAQKGGGHSGGGHSGGGHSAPVTFTMRFRMDGSFTAGSGEDLLLLTVEENPLTSQIVSIHTENVSAMSAVAKERETIFSSRSFSVTPFYETEMGKHQSGRLWSFWKRIGKKKSDSLYSLVDEVFFKPEGGFGLKEITADKKIVAAGDIADSPATESEQGRTLLFIHGIFSNIGACFKDFLWAAEFHKSYKGGIYGFDHPTVCRSAKDNALELANAIPAGTKLDIICHSRGGLVTRCFLEHETIRGLLREKGITVHRVLFVAGACKGSPFASKEFLNTFLMTATALGLILSTQSLFAIIVEFAKFAHDAPGISCLAPESKLITEELNQKKNSAELFAFYRANFDPAGWIYDCIDELAIDFSVFRGAANDMVVPFAGADISDEYPAEKRSKGMTFGDEEQDQSKIYHLSFFDNKEAEALKVKKGIIDFMCG